MSTANTTSTATMVSDAEIVREYGPGAIGEGAVHGVTFDGKLVWFARGPELVAFDPDAEAVVRELSEETGLRVEPGRLIGSVERPGPDGVTYDIHDYAATVTGGELSAGDDAADARWTTPAELRRLPTTDGLLEALTSWRVLPGG